MTLFAYLSSWSSDPSARSAKDLCRPGGKPESAPTHARWRTAKYLAPAVLAGAFLFSGAGHAQQQRQRENMPPQNAAGSEQIQIDTGKATETLFSATNAYRTENKIKELVWNNPLWQAAQQYAEFLAANKTYGHQADGKTPQQRADEKDYRCPVSENTFLSLIHI